MNQQLAHIFDDSTCLNKRQMKDYVSGTMTKEECHAAEVHLSGCPLCSEAVDGLMMNKEEAAEMLAGLNTDFIKEHFSSTIPQVHLNSIAHAGHAPVILAKRGKKVHYFWKVTSVAAGLLLVCFGVWYLTSNNGNNEKIAEATISEMSAEAAAPGPNKNQDNSAILPANSASNSERQNTIIVVADSVQSRPASAPIEQKSIAEDMIQGNAPAAGQPPANAAETQNYGFRNQQGGDRLNYNYSNYNQGAAYQNTYKWNNADTTVPLAKRSADKEDIKISGARTSGTVAIIDGVKVDDNDDISTEKALKAKKAPVKESNAADKADNYEVARKHYDDKNYTKALSAAQADLKSADKKRRHKAMILAAECYTAMGNKEKAKDILQQVVEEGGPQKAKARWMLRDMK